MLIGWINTWNAFEHWTTGLFVVWLCACVCGSGRIFWDSVCCLIMLRSSYFAAQYSKHMKRGMPEVKHHPSCVWFLQSSDRLLSWERLLDCTMYCLVWGEEKFEAENPFLSLFLSHTHTFSLFLSAWMRSVLAASANPAGMHEECERWVRDWERDWERGIMWVAYQELSNGSSYQSHTWPPCRQKIELVVFELQLVIVIFIIH